MQVGSIKNPFAMITSLNFTLESEDLFFWYKRKKWFLWTMPAAENRAGEWDLTWYFLWGIYTSVSTEPYSQISLVAAGSTKFKDILPWNISQMAMKTLPISHTRIVKAMRWSRASHCEFDRKSMETETKTWSTFPNGRKAISVQNPSIGRKK